MIRAFVVSAFAVFLGGCSSGVVPGFDVNGFHSGMTTEQLVAVAKSRGLEAAEMQRAPGEWSIGKLSRYEVDGSFAFCGAEGLVSYTHNIDFDVDYIPQLESLIQKLGPPRRVSTLRAPMAGNETVLMPEVDLTWNQDKEEIILSFSPATKELLRGAYISYITKNSCNKTFSEVRRLQHGGASIIVSLARYRVQSFQCPLSFSVLNKRLH